VTDKGEAEVAVIESKPVTVGLKATERI